MTAYDPDIPNPFAYSALLNHASLLTLSQTLFVQWPDWYLTVVGKLIGFAADYGDWLPGGFLYSKPHLIFRDTHAFRCGINKIEGFRPQQGPVRSIGMPYSMVIVGGTGSGPVVIDTLGLKAAFQQISSDDARLNEFIQIGEGFANLDAFIQSMIET